MSKRSHLLQADYTEDNVAVALEMLLTTLSFPLHRFSIDVMSRKRERLLGADARLNGRLRGFRPFYMQFKRPSAYPDYSSSRIIVDRAALGLSCAPHTLFFPLRDKKRGQREFQHNALLKLRRRLQSRGLGEAAYVCPLFLDHVLYRSAMHCSGLIHWFAFWRHRPWLLEDALIHDGGRTIAFDRIPILAEHVTIPPHTLVTDAKHHYSFDERGGQLCFHDPTPLPDGSSNLAKFLSQVAERFLGEGGTLQVDESDAVLSQLSADLYGEPFALDDLGDDPIGRWYEWGFRLRRDFGIMQYAFIQWDEPVV